MSNRSPIRNSPSTDGATRFGSIDGAAYASQPTSTLELTLPHLNDRPPQSTKCFLFSHISRLVRRELACPPLGVRGRSNSAMLTLMCMPKAAIDEDRDAKA